MYIRTVTAKGNQYVQLAHNIRDPETGVTKPQILYSFGRADQLDLDALRRLVKSIARFLEPGEVRQVEEQLGVDIGFDYLGSRRLGGTWFLDALWKKLGVGGALERLLADRRFRTPVERLVFAMTASRALAPSSKLALENWVADEVLIPDLPDVEVHQLYRAMDFLLEAGEAIQHDVFFAVAHLFNLECDLIFLDTTTTYFEIEGEDPDEWEDDGEDLKAEGLRKRGYSKDGRSGAAQVVIGWAVTRGGLPVRCWVWPGNRADQNLVEEVKRDLNGWRLGRIITVLDAGFNSEENRRVLQGAGGHYIIGEKLRQGREGLPVEALRRAGTYRQLEGGLQIKEVTVGEGPARQRFVVVRNPQEAERDRTRREEIVAEVERRLVELQQLDGEPHKKAACALRAHSTFGRYVRQTKAGKLQVNRAKIRQEERLDGKFLIRVSDDQLAAEDAVLGYKQLWQIERVFRDLKHVVDIRPVYHRLEDRIRAHVLLCWLAVLLIRVAENETGQTWHRMQQQLERLEVGIHHTRSGEVWQTNRPTEELEGLFQTLDLKLPPRYLAIPVLRQPSA
ncbi:MAG: IS1634 family transposase [Candidatus Bipolaricaulota bacterium]